MQSIDTPEAWKRALLLPLATLLYEGACENGELAWSHAVDLIKGFAPMTELEYRLAVRVSILTIQINYTAQWTFHPETTMSQTIRLQANMLKLVAAAERDEERLRQLQAARIKRAEAARSERPARPAPQSAAPSQGAVPPSTATLFPNAKAQARAIREYAQKSNLTYAEVWGLYERKRKAAEQAAEGSN